MKEVIYLLFHLLTTQDRALLGFWSLFLSPRRIARSAIIVKPSTLLRFHNALKKRKYRLLYSLCGGRKPGPKGPSKEIIDAIVEMKQRNPRFGCPRIAQQINLAFGLHLDKDVVRRIIGFAVHAGHIDVSSVCRTADR
jgi:putative transposase